MAKTRHADTASHDFPSPNLSPAELRRMVQLEEEKKLAKASSQRFSLMHGYTNTNSKGKKSETSSRSLLSVSGASKSNSSARSLFSINSKDSNSRPLIEPVFEENESDVQAEEGMMSTVVTENSEQKRKKENQSLNKLVEAAKNLSGRKDGKKGGRRGNFLKSESSSSFQDDGDDTGSTSLMDMEDVSLDDHSFGSQHSSFSNNIYSNYNSDEENSNIKSEEDSMGKTKRQEQNLNLSPKQTRCAIIGTAITVLVVVAVTISLTIGGLLDLKAEIDSELLLQHNNTSMPTIFRTMHPTISPKSILNQNLSRDSFISPSASPSVHINRKRTKQPMHTLSFNDPISDRPSFDLHNITKDSSLLVNNGTIMPKSSDMSGQRDGDSKNSTNNITETKEPSNLSNIWAFDISIPLQYTDEYMETSKYVIELSDDGSLMVVSFPFVNKFTGLVKIYKTEMNRWKEVATILGKSFDDEFGFSISLTGDGTKVAIGTSGANSNSYVQVHGESSSGTWNQIGEDLVLEGVSTSRGTGFGFSLSLASDGSLLAIGSPFASRNGIPDSGRVDFFQIDQNEQWVPFGDGLDGPVANGGFGMSLSLGGEFVAIGAPKMSYVHIYRMFQVTGGWEMFGEELNGLDDDDLFGQSVAMSTDGLRFCISAPRNSNMGEKSGVVSTYERMDDSHFYEIGGYMYGQDPGSLHGNILSLSGDGNRIAVGGEGVRIYDLELGVWQKTDLEVEKKINNVVVSLSNDGKKLAVLAEPSILLLYTL